MNPILDFTLWLLVILILATLFIVNPIITAYYLYNRLWMSDRLRLFLSISLFLSAIGIAAIVIAKLMTA